MGWTGAFGIGRKGPRPEDEAAAAEECEQRGDLAGAEVHWREAVARERRLSGRVGAVVAAEPAATSAARAAWLEAHPRSNWTIL